ncbi:helix-turn-helix domain-containing protein [Schlesneria sp. T3-172]|uniref:helix-turn-helix transcriptional regulator n=1 Tax=Schlesneria TaxID=656899 RepID=UPI002EE7AE82
MSRSDQKLSETDIRPAGALVYVVRADTDDSREWLSESPICPELQRYRIRHLAVAKMASPFQIVRTRLSGSYFLACFGGEGRVLVDGRWTDCGPGQAVLLPPGTLQAFHTTPGRVWDFCWVRYQERAGQQPLISAHSPVLTEFDPEGLRLAILGLYHECLSRQSITLSDSNTPPSDQTVVGRWIDLVNHYVLRFAVPTRLDARIWQLWEQVAASLDQSWTVTQMAEIVHLSEKQLQRLCLRELGRTPRQQLIWLRMRKAAELLSERSSTVESIAVRVGYKNPFVFSSIFKRVMGWSPSNYPHRK